MSKDSINISGTVYNCSTALKNAIRKKVADDMARHKKQIESMGKSRDEMIERRSREIEQLREQLKQAKARLATKLNTPREVVV